MKIVVAQCTDQKRTGTWPAKELYMESDLFQAQRRYAEAYADTWFIISGKHGLLRPWDRISDYDLHISNGWRELTQEVVDQRVELWAERDDPDVELICGHEEYAKRLIPYLEFHDLEYSEPFMGLGIGERTQAMIEQARRVENKQLDAYA